MKKLLAAAALALALAPWTSAHAGGKSSGNVPDATLARLGLGGMQTLSSTEGKKIRGKGFYMNVFQLGIAFPGGRVIQSIRINIIH